jgi:hypothetical protein
MLAVVLLGGTAVLASYAYALGMAPSTRSGLWGGVPAVLLPAYVALMALATAGYFAFTFFLLFCADPGIVQIAGRFRYRVFLVLYVMILAPSAMWLPLTSVMVEKPSSLLWLAIQVVLAMVGLASIVLLLALLSLRPRQPNIAYWAAVVGAVAFCLQTAVLDLFVWTAHFPA